MTAHRGGPGVIHFEGEHHFPRPPAEVAARLSDAGWLAGCLPDALVTEAGPDRAAWKLKPKLSFLSGSLDVVLAATAREPGASVAYRVTAKTIGAGSVVNAALVFAERDGGTAVGWAGDLVDVTGLLKMVPKGLLQGSAEAVIADVWASVRAKLAAGG